MQDARTIYIRDVPNKRDLACKVESSEKKLKELEKKKNLALEQHSEAKKNAKKERVHIEEA